MTAPSWTPGPWKANLYLGGAYAIDRVAPNGDRIVSKLAVVDGTMETQANAHLIAAAPDLYEALAWLHSLVRGECPSLLNEDSDGDVLCDMAVEDALEKARGET